MTVTQLKEEVGKICQNNHEMKFGPEVKALDI